MPWHNLPKSRLRFRQLTSLLAASVLSVTAALAEEPKLFDPVNILTQPRIMGDWGGVRNWAETNGVSFTGQLVNDMLWNMTGGISPGGADDGLLQFGTQIDTEKAIGLPGGTFKNTWFWLYGRNPSGFVGDVNAVSGISANPAFRCYELWYEQNLAFGGVDDAVSLRGGLLGLDAEFCISDPALLFVNGTFGLPALMSQNLVNSGPQYPMATPGVRLALHPYSWLRLRGALTQANPFSQSENLHNFNWNFGPSGGLLSMNEAELAWGEADTSRILPARPRRASGSRMVRRPHFPTNGLLAHPPRLLIARGSTGCGIRRSTAPPVIQSHLPAKKPSFLLLRTALIMLLKRGSSRSCASASAPSRQALSRSTPMAAWSTPDCCQTVPRTSSAWPSAMGPSVPPTGHSAISRGCRELPSNPWPS